MDGIRKQASELENHLIDEYAAGRISRRELLRRGTVVGMSIPLLSFIAACAGDDNETEQGATTGASEGTAQPGATIRIAMVTPSTAVDPLVTNNLGALGTLSIANEFLIWSDRELVLQPRLAESWEPNADSTVWTFTIRQGVTFHDGMPMTAKDVAATIQRLADPKSESNALSVFGRVLVPEGVKALDDTTVEFRLEAPNGNLPYLVSSDNYNAVILKADYAGDFEQNWNGTGPMKLESYTARGEAAFVKNPNYWDTARQPIADRVVVRYYDDEAAMDLALQGGEIDVINTISAATSAALLSDPEVSIIETRATTHRQVHMRTDREPFADKRVRQALALALNRQELVDGLLAGNGDLGNDSPFAPVLPSTDPSIPQREQDLDQARQLLADAGKGDGFTVPLSTLDVEEIPDLAQLIQTAAQEIGITIELNITDTATYYGDAVYGSSPWLDSDLGITNYAHRGVPNTILLAPLTSDGSWNAAHFKKPTYDQLVADYAAASDLDAQRAVAKQIQELLLDETPIIFPYFQTYLTATRADLTGIEVTATGHIDASRAGSSA